MNNSICTYVEHCLVPQQRERVEFECSTLAELAPDWGGPFIALVDGKAVLRKDWGTLLFRGHAVVFIDARAFPQGGGGSDPLRLIATLAVLAFSIALPGAGFAADMMFATGFGTAAGWTALASGAIFFGGMTLVNAMLPPETASLSGSKALESPSPTYSLQAQGNYARLEQAVPEHFGRHIVFPDFGANPYQEAIGNEIYLHQVLVLSRGSGTIESKKIADTVFENFDNIETEIVEPHGQITLFPAAVDPKDEVSGQDLPTDEYVGPYTAVKEENEAIAIGVDFTAPRGLYHALNSGKLASVTVTVQIEAREIDLNGDPLGNWETLGLCSYSAATTTPQRYSEKFTVSAGRYEVRCKRTDEEQTDTAYGHDFVWSGLKSFMQETTDYGDVTLLAIRMQASSQLSSQASRKINCIFTRKLPVWDGETWSLPQETKSVAWAAAYICKQVGLTDDKIDLAKLLYLETNVWGPGGDECNGRIDSFLSFWDALSKVCLAGRCKPFIQGGVVRFHHDSEQSLPVALFSMRNIVKNSFSVNYLQPTEDTADAVNVTYFDEDVWRQRTVKCVLADSTDSQPAKVEVSFVTNRDKAHEYGLYSAACNQRRRKLITFQTEMDGFIPSYGDQILVQHDMPAWGIGGEVIYFGAGAVTATIGLSEPIEWSDGATHYVTLTGLDGAVHGPYEATEVDGDEYSLLIDIADLDGFVPYTGSEYDRARFTFGPGEKWAQKALVLSIKPKARNRVEIQAVNDDPAVYTAAQGVTTPAPATSLLDNYTSRPIVSGVTATVSPTDQAKILLSWSPAPWADHYLVEISSDSTTWTRVAEPQTTSCTVDALYGTGTMIRVAAVGVNVGPWVEIAYTTVQQIEWDASLSGFAVTLNKANAVLSWDTSANWNVSGYECRVGADWDTGTPLFTKKTGDSYSYQPGAGGYTYHFKSINKFGEYSADTATASLTITAPSLQYLSASARNYLVTLTWEEIEGTFPVEIAEIRKGAVFADADVIGKSTGDYLQLTESAPGTYTYWVRLKDTSGNYSTEFSVSASVAAIEDIVSDLEGMLTYQALDASLADRIDLIDGSALTPGTIPYQFAQIQSQVNDLLNLPEYSAANEPYPEAYTVKYDGAVYVSNQATNGDLPSLETCWDKIGDYASLGEAVAANAAQINSVVNGLTAETNARETLAAQLRGTYSGTDIENVTSGLLLSEKNARAAADGAQSSSISVLQSSISRVGFFYHGGESDESEFSVSSNATVSPSTDAYEGDASLLVTYSGVSDPNSYGGSSGAAWVDIQEQIALVFAGNLIRVTVFAKQPDANASAEFALSYSTAEVGNSGWERFSPTASWGKFTFTYDCPEPINGGTDNLNIWGDTSNSGKGVLIDSIYIEAITNESDLPGIATNTAAIQQEATTRVSGDEAEATARQTLATQLRGDYEGTAINQVTSGLLYAERQARLTATSAITQELNTLEASFSDLENDVANRATITQLNTAIADEESARTTAITQSASTVTDGYTAAIQYEATTRASQTGALFAELTWKIDNDGYVTGWGLASTGPTGEGSVANLRVDKFAIAPSAGTNGTVQPFVYDAISGYMSLEGAYIKHLSVDTLQLANQSVTVLTTTNATSLSAIDEYSDVELLSHTIDAYGGTQVKIDICITISSVSDIVYLTLKRNGVAIGSQFLGRSTGTFSYFENDTPPSGEIEYTVVARTNYGNSSIVNKQIAVFERKK